MSEATAAGPQARARLLHTTGLYRLRQGYAQRSTFSLPSGPVIRTVLQRDAYDHQGHFVCEVFSPRDFAWHELATIPSEMLGHLPSYVDRDDEACANALEEVERELLDYALLVFESSVDIGLS